MGRGWSSRGAQPGVARCTHAGPWLESNLFVPLPNLVAVERKSCRIASDLADRRAAGQPVFFWAVSQAWEVGRSFCTSRILCGDECTNLRTG